MITDVMSKTFLDGKSSGKVFFVSCGTKNVTFGTKMMTGGLKEDGNIGFIYNSLINERKESIVCFMDYMR